MNAAYFDPRTKGVRVRITKTGTPPVPNSEMLDLFFMDAAQGSKDSGGKPASLQ